MKIIECVPNFSEGRDARKMAAIASAIETVPGVRLADYSGDVDHHRSVFTFLGKPEEVLNAALAASEKALKLIDMREQSGVHPRLGAVDVVPFIPLGRTSMKEAVHLAHLFGRQYSERFSVPVYFYGSAALTPHRKELADIRRGGYETLKQKMGEPKNLPDVGGSVFNEKSGATVVGARPPLVAFNINLASDDLVLAQHIASRIRGKNGGFKNVRAIGVLLKSRGVAQVSMNLTDCRETPLKVIFDRVQNLAAERGVNILESELIGLMPKCALFGTTPQYLKLKDFSERRLLETHIRALEAAG
jgi:glutamate formiminotransferase